jgi:hypothetical protein
MKVCVTTVLEVGRLRSGLADPEFACLPTEYTRLPFYTLIISSTGELTTHCGNTRIASCVYLGTFMDPMF